MQLGLGVGINKGGAAAPALPPEEVGVTYVGGVGATSINSTTYTFSDVDIGTPSAFRKVLILVAYEDVERSGIPSMEGMTVNGQAATELVDRTVNSDFGSAQYIIDMPTGTSADIQLTFNTANAWGARVDIYNLEMDTVTAHATFNGASGLGDVAATISVVEKGAIIMHCYRKTSFDVQTSRNNVFNTETASTEDFEGTYGGLLNRKVACGHALIPADDASYVCHTAAGTGFTDVVYTVTSFAP